MKLTAFFLLVFALAGCSEWYAFHVIDENCNQIIYDCGSAQMHQKCVPIITLPCGTEKCKPSMIRE